MPELTPSGGRARHYGSNPFVPTPTHASQLNPIETHFRKIHWRASTASTYTEWGEAEGALCLAIRRPNRVHRVTHSRPGHRWWTRH
jgi:hypothetical protein